MCPLGITHVISAVRPGSPRGLISVENKILAGEMPRTARGTVVQQNDSSARVGASTPQVARNLSQQQLRELLTTLMHTPADVVLRVGFILRLFVAVIQTGLAAGDSFSGSRSSGGLAASLSPRRALAPRYRSDVTVEEREQAEAIIAIAKQDIKQTKRAGARKGKRGSGAAKGRFGGEKAKNDRNLMSWAAKAKRAMPSLLELLKSGATAIGTEHAGLIKSHAETIPAEKAARVSETVVCE